MQKQFELFEFCLIWSVLNGQSETMKFCPNEQKINCKYFQIKMSTHINFEHMQMV